MVTVTPVRAFTDNYIWVLSSAGEAVAVDPGDAAPLLEFIEQNGLALTAVLITHHHADHVGGLARLRTACPQLTVYGPPGIRGVTHPVKEGDSVTVLGNRFEVLAVPGHTLDHIAYYDGNHLFCGDTLFGAGCGRLFEGSPAQMFHSLQKLAALPEVTRIYPAHEYTLSNLRFAAAAEPANQDIARRRAADEASLVQGRPTLPSTLAEEKRTNPFLRAQEPALRQSAERHQGSSLADPVAVFAALRAWKNTF
jgi:hydroxyacylglutathione hydrolase